MRACLLRLSTRALGAAAALLFLAGAVSMTSGTPVAGVLSPTAAVIAGSGAFCLWLVLSMLMADAVKTRPRRRPSFRRSNKVPTRPQCRPGE